MKKLVTAAIAILSFAFLSCVATMQEVQPGDISEEPPAAVEPAPQPGSGGKCTVNVTVGNQVYACSPGPASCQGATNQCKRQFLNARSYVCQPGCK